jgi:hypothetical protein
VGKIDALGPESVDEPFEDGNKLTLGKQVYPSAEVAFKSKPQETCYPFELLEAFLNSYPPAGVNDVIPYVPLVLIDAAVIDVASMVQDAAAPKRFVINVGRDDQGLNRLFIRHRSARKSRLIHFNSPIRITRSKKGRSRFDAITVGSRGFET